jgi:cysteine desulfurase
VVFTASGTEANNAVVFGAGLAHRFTGRLVISAFEHPSIEAAAERLEGMGMEVVRVAPSADGVVAAAAVAAALTADTRLVCLMLAQNELGTLQPVAEVAAACRERGIPVLCDAVQAVGKIPVDAGGLGVDFLTLGGHKFHGPLGVAALVVRGGAELVPLLVGGKQERRRRAGTANVPGIVGLGEACALAAAELADRKRHLGALRDRFEAGLAAVPGAAVHAARAPRLPNTSHVAFSGVEGEALMVRLDLAGYAVSTGSACASGVVEPSRATLAVGMAPEEAVSSLRVSFGMTNTAAEVDRFLAALGREVEALRELAPAAAAGSRAR